MPGIPFFPYDEDKACLDISFDPLTSEAAIRGGLHGFACLAELFAIYSTVKGKKWEDDHWHNLKTQKHGFTIVVADKFGKTKIWLIAEIRYEPTVTYTTQADGPDVESRTEDTIFLRGNANAFVWLAEIISGFLLTSPPVKLSCQIDTSQFSKKEGLKINFVFDPLFD